MRKSTQEPSIWELIDRQATLRRLADDESLFRELVEFFLVDHGPMIAAVEFAAIGHDAAALQRAAHSLKGLAANLGAAALADIAAELEASARQQNWPPVEKALPRLKYELGRLVNALEHYRAAQG